MTMYLLVSGDFTTWGGMDRANYELAWYLADHVGASVHLVSYLVAEPLADHPNVTWHRVPKPLNNYTLAEPLLSREARRVSQTLTERGARIIINGGICTWPAINWVHAVHAAWGTRDVHAPILFRLRAAWLKRKNRRAEFRALSKAKLVLTNSERARQQIIEQVGVSPSHVRAVYYGTDPEVFRPVSDIERTAARKKLNWSDERYTAVFVGALGHDRNKGFDILFAAWELLCKDPGWDVDLVSIGGGAEVELWRKRAVAIGLGERVYIMGFSKQVADVLAAADVLVSPTHYDAYGLGVQEALCAGLPAFVTCSAGIAERYPADLADLLLNDPPEATDLVQRLLRWRANMPHYQAHAARFGEMLRQRTWADMASEITGLMESLSSSSSHICI